jgi:phospholipid-translocating ATPase
VDFSENRFHEAAFQFYDENLLAEVKKGNTHTHLFFRVLALCHTVMPDYSKGSEYLIRCT